MVDLIPRKTGEIGVWVGFGRIGMVKMGRKGMRTGFLPALGSGGSVAKSDEKSWVRQARVVGRAFVGVKTSVNLCTGSGETGCPRPKSYLKRVS